MNLVRAFATVAGSTLVSRVLGFVRDVLLAANLGTGPVADAFLVAFRFPNLFRRFFAEGAFNAAFVPIFAKHYETGGTAGPARRFAEEVLSGLLFFLLLFTAVAQIAMPWLMLAFAPGFSADPEKFDLTVALTRLAFPYLLLMSLTALLSGVLNAMGRFAVAAAAPILLNVVLISVLTAISLTGAANTPRAGYWLAAGVTLAGALQLLMLTIACAHAGLLPKLRRPHMTDDVRRFIRLGIPGLIAGGITQINIFIGTVIASMQAGAVSYLYFADRIYQLPLGVVGIAIGIVLLPDLSRKLRSGDMTAVHESQNRSFEYAMLLTLPAAIALAVMPGPIISVLFERGAFDESDRIATSAALAAFAFGLPSFVLIKVFSPGFFAREDTKTPMQFAFAGMVVNVAASLALFPSIGHVGIAVATSISGWVNAALLGITLWRRGHYAPDRQILQRLPRILLASILMGAGLWLTLTPSAPYLDASGPLAIKAAALTGLVAVGIVLYFGAAQLTGGTDLRDLIQILTGRRRPGGANENA